MDKYELEERIGEGSFGKVFRGRRKDNGQNVALKFVPKLGRSEREIKSLRQECEIQKNLNHPNIIHMLDSFETDSSVVVVTEYAARGELSGLLEREKRLSIAHVKVIACDLVSALNYLHSRRILHRDMKPQNILIGSDGLYKLCDFGFARTMGIDTYMLTSIKGTPLYMAPEIIGESPYDHNADLWSLGCILYELLVGRPPFFTTSLFQLVNMIRYETIIFPDFIVGDCRSFLQGLLEKNSKARLTWPQLLSHPFVSDGLRVDQETAEFSLTKALSPSQEFAKERQRQNLQRKLAGYSKLLIKTAKKLEEAKKELNKCGNEVKAQPLPLIPTPRSSPKVQQPKIAPQEAKLPQIGKCGDSEIGGTVNAGGLEVPNVTSLLKNLNFETQLTKVISTTGEGAETLSDSGSSCETLTSSSSECETDLESEDDGQTVIVETALTTKSKRKGDTGNKKATRRISNEDAPGDKVQVKEKEDNDTLWKSGALFTLHSFGSEDKPIHSEEWVYFLLKTMKEVIDNPASLCEKHFLTIIVAPLRNHLALPEVVEKIATLLSVPFTMEAELHLRQPGFMISLQTIFLDSKVLPNLLYSSKLMVRRRKLERGSVELSEIAAVLTAEDLDALDKCLRLVCFLVYADEEFVVQFCDSVCVLQLFPVLQLFLKLDKRKSRLATDTLAILCQVLRTIPTNSSIIEELFIESVESEEDGGNCSELWRLLQHSNTSIKSRSLRMLAYLVLHSQRTRIIFVRNNCNKLWKLVREASMAIDPAVREAAVFALQNMKHVSSLKVVQASNHCRINRLNNTTTTNSDNAQSR